MELHPLVVLEWREDHHLSRRSVMWITSTPTPVMPSDRHGDRLSCVPRVSTVRGHRLSALTSRGTRWLLATADQPEFAALAASSPSPRSGVDDLLSAAVE